MVKVSLKVCCSFPGKCPSLKANRFRWEWDPSTWLKLTAGLFNIICRILKVQRNQSAKCCLIPCSYWNKFTQVKETCTAWELFLPLAFPRLWCSFSWEDTFKNLKSFSEKLSLIFYSKAKKPNASFSSEVNFLVLNCRHGLRPTQIKLYAVGVFVVMTASFWVLMPLCSRSLDGPLRKELDELFVRSKFNSLSGSLPLHRLKTIPQQWTRIPKTPLPSLNLFCRDFLWKWMRRDDLITSSKVNTRGFMYHVKRNTNIGTFSKSHKREKLWSRSVLCRDLI